MEVDFEHFVGKEWMLRGCDHHGPGQMRVALNDAVYIVYEDESDGYCSSLRELTVIGSPTKDDLPTNLFQPVRVRAQKAVDYDRDVLQFVDCANNKLVIEIGTDNSDDYYPSFVAYFDPLSLSVNKPYEPPNLGTLDYRKRRIRLRGIPPDRSGHKSRQAVRRIGRRARGRK